MRNANTPPRDLPPLDMPDPIVLEPADEAEADEAWCAWCAWVETGPAELGE